MTWRPSGGGLPTKVRPDRFGVELLIVRGDKYFSDSVPSKTRKGPAELHLEFAIECYSVDPFATKWASTGLRRHVQLALGRGAPPSPPFAKRRSRTAPSRGSTPARVTKQLERWQR
jgi:hypothetical protein